MSSIFIIAPLLALIASISIYALVHVVRRRHGELSNSTSAGCVIPVLVLVILTILFSAWIPRLAIKSGRKVSPQLANAHLLTFDIPTVATNVDYRSSIFSGQIDAADFDIKKEEFLKWMAESNCKPVAFSMIEGRTEWDDGKDRVFDVTFVTPLSAMLGDSEDDIQIESGLYYDDYDLRGDDNSGMAIIFDSHQQRAYVRQTTF